LSHRLASRGLAINYRSRFNRARVSSDSRQSRRFRASRRADPKRAPRGHVGFQPVASSLLVLVRASSLGAFLPSLLDLLRRAFNGDPLIREIESRQSTRRVDVSFNDRVIERFVKSKHHVTATCSFASRTPTC